MTSSSISTSPSSALTLTSPPPTFPSTSTFLLGNVAFDELPRPDINSEAVDFRAASELRPAVGLALLVAARRVHESRTAH